MNFVDGQNGLLLTLLEGLIGLLEGPFVDGSRKSALYPVFNVLETGRDILNVMKKRAVFENALPVQCVDLALRTASLADASKDLLRSPVHLRWLAKMDAPALVPVTTKNI